MKKGKVVALLILFLICGVCAYYFFILDKTPPKIYINEGKFIGGDSDILSVEVIDDNSFIREINILISQNRLEKNINLDGENQNKIKKQFNLKKLGFKDGKIQVKITAYDKSINNLLKGNENTVTKEYILDTTPPTIYLKTYKHNLKIGGSGVAGFSVSEPVKKLGILSGGYFFPAYKYDEKNYICFFSIPYFVKDKNLNTWVMAVDLAGNQKKTPLNCYIRNPRFQSVNINISARFLNTKMKQFENQYKGLTPLEIFLKVNRELRAQNREELKELGKITEKKILFKGAFLRLPNSARKESFATKRSYFYQGKKIDEQTHLGIDLASIARADVPASNSGKVIFAGWFGIYGNAVVIDHGYGIQSLYGHLSFLGVRQGQFVNKGDIIGKTGATGLAGGDHLHFAILISGMPVDPVEWWDRRWIANNITFNLKALSE